MKIDAFRRIAFIGFYQRNMSQCSVQGKVNLKEKITIIFHISVAKDKFFPKFYGGWKETVVLLIGCENYFAVNLGNLRDRRFQFLGNVPINAKIFQIFLKCIYYSHLWTLFECLSKIVLDILQFFFKILWNFCVIFPQFSYKFFKIFLEFLQSPYRKARNLPEISGKIFITFTKLFQNVSKIFSKISRK